MKQHSNAAYEIGRRRGRTSRYHRSGKKEVRIMSRLHRWIMPSILLITFSVTVVPGYCQDAKSPDVIFVPTEQAVVDEMLRMANLSENSVVYDLGCGDGRIVITAAIHYAARGVGIDIDPERIRESKQNARAMGVLGPRQVPSRRYFSSRFPRGYGSYVVPLIGCERQASSVAVAPTEAGNPDCLARLPDGGLATGRNQLG